MNDSCRKNGALEDGKVVLFEFVPKNICMGIYGRVLPGLQSSCNMRLYNSIKFGSVEN